MGLRCLEAPRIPAGRDVHGTPTHSLHARSGAQNGGVRLRVSGVQDSGAEGRTEHHGHVNKLRDRGRAANGRQSRRVGAFWRCRAVQSHGLIRTCARLA